MFAKSFQRAGNNSCTLLGTSATPFLPTRSALRKICTSLPAHVENSSGVNQSTLSAASWLESFSFSP